MVGMLSAPMNLQELFRREDVLVEFDARDKWDAIARLVSHLEASGRIGAAQAGSVLESVTEREKSMSTGMERGLAIPHAAVDELESVAACLAVTEEPGLNFESIDGSPTRFVVLLVIPRSQKLLHIRTLADVARVLGKDSVREGLVAAASPEEAWKVLTAGDVGALRSCDGS